MASLVRREVLVMQTDPRSPERGQYEFVQALVRTIAYETIGRRERKRRHKAAAEYLEALGGEELSEVIAAHYVDAYRLAPDDADAEQLRDQAKRGLLRAVERARSLAATGEAERLMRAAIDLTDDPAERATAAGGGRPADARRRAARRRDRAVRGGRRAAAGAGRAARRRPAAGSPGGGRCSWRGAPTSRWP